MAQVQMFYDDNAVTFFYKRDYLQGRLNHTLTAGKSYCVTFYVNLEEASGYAINHIGAYLDNGSIDTGTVFYCAQPQTEYTPQVLLDTIIRDTMNWTKIEGNFVSNGTEKFITIGNFFDKAHTAYEQTFFPNETQATWYLVDDISVIESDHLPFAGNDTVINAGDSVYLGPHEIALPYVWYTLGNVAPIDSGGGMWVHPDTTTRYVLEQTLCGVKTYDTVKVNVGDTTTAVAMMGGAIRNVLVYPNPAKDVVNIANGAGTTATIYDLVGKKVKEVAVNSSRMQIPIGDLASGVYLVEIRASDGSRKVVRLLHGQGE